MTTKSNTLIISAVKQGVVIDHITAGQALNIAKLFQLATNRRRITLALNLPSASMEAKDLIKLEEHSLSDHECDQIAVLAPNATVNVIEDYEVIDKMKLELPDTIADISLCPNERCITNHEPMGSLFHVKKRGPNVIQLRCHYCRKIFMPHQNET